MADVVGSKESKGEKPTEQASKMADAVGSEESKGEKKASKAKADNPDYRWIYCTLNKKGKEIIQGTVKGRGPWSYAYGGRAVMKRRREDDSVGAFFKPRTNNFWIRIYKPEESQKEGFYRVWVFENHSPGKDKYQAKNGDFLVRMTDWRPCQSLEEAKEEGYGRYPAHWTLHKFIVCVKF